VPPTHCGHRPGVSRLTCIPQKRSSPLPQPTAACRVCNAWIDVKHIRWVRLMIEPQGLAHTSVSAKRKQRHATEEHHQLLHTSRQRVQQHAAPIAPSCSPPSRAPSGTQRCDGTLRAHAPRARQQLLVPPPQTSCAAGRIWLLVAALKSPSTMLPAAASALASVRWQLLLTPGSYTATGTGTGCNGAALYTATGTGTPDSEYLAAGLGVAGAMSATASLPLPLVYTAAA
jgi:hypothetical protein